MKNWGMKKLGGMVTDTFASDLNYLIEKNQWHEKLQGFHTKQPTLLLNKIENFSL